jgi:predicted CXXCH cytochrome family protein
MLLAAALVGAAARATPPEGAERASTPAATCLECHEGHAGGHRIDIDYAAAAAENPRLAPLERLPPEVPLVDGRVSCTSCHDGASTIGALLALPPKQLCLSCHPI